MQRTYSTGTATTDEMFVGREVEHTPAYGKLTLFVTGLRSIEEIEAALNHYNQHEADYDDLIKHIFFGANHSFHPEPNNAVEWDAWETMIQHFLSKDMLCSLDIPLASVEEFHDLGLCVYNTFIPQIRVPLPYIRLWNYNTMLKLDDRTFDSTNPGVWTHSLHELQDRNKFTEWSKYSLDTIVKPS